MCSHQRAVILAVVTLLGCEGEAAKGPEPKAPTGANASVVDLYFPLEEGKIYHYVTQEGGDSGMLVAKVHRPDRAHGELRLSNATKRFTIGPDGVAYQDGPYILKAPLDVGASWPGEHGGTTKVVATDASVSVPAGQYASCVKTVEEGGRPPGSVYETTYCPGVGMVLLVVRASGNEARAELKSYGMPVKIE